MAKTLGTIGLVMMAGGLALLVYGVVLAAGGSGVPAIGMAVAGGLGIGFTGRAIGQTGKAIARRGGDDYLAELLTPQPRR